MLSKLCLEEQISTKQKRKSGSLRGFKKNVRIIYPDFDEDSVTKAQDAASNWFDHNHHVFESEYADKLPNIFKSSTKRTRVKQTKVETPVTEHVTEQVTEHVGTMQDCIQAIMNKSKAKIKWSQGDQTLEAEWSN